MATQNGPIIWEKTFPCGVSFYKRLGRGCVRMKSNLTGERWRKDPAFEGSRLSAACMALGSKLGSAVYQTIPIQHRRYPHYKELVGIAQKTLRQGYNLEQVNKVLQYAVARYLRKLQAADPNRKPERSSFAATLSLNSKPTYTSVIPHQLIVPQFTDPTISRPVFKLWPVMMPPRGSPTFTAAVNKTGTLKAATCHLWQYSCRNQPLKMAGLAISQPIGLAQKSPNQLPNTPKKHQQIMPENNFLPSRCSRTPHKPSLLIYEKLRFKSIGSVY